MQHQNDRPSRLGFGLPLTASASHHLLAANLPLVPTMAPESQRQTGRDDVLSKLNEAIGDLDRAKEESSISPAKAVFASTGALLPTIRVSSPSTALKGGLLAHACRIRWVTERAISN